jgi:hypothetical protein
MSGTNDEIEFFRQLDIEMPGRSLAPVHCSVPGLGAHLVRSHKLRDGVAPETLLDGGADQSGMPSHEVVMELT